MIEKESEEIEVEIDETEEEEGVLVKYDIATYPSDFTLGGIYDKWNDDEIVIPDFQRKFVWKITQSSLLIESFLLGLPVPPVFFYIDDDNKNVVIDGQQRILSCVYYFDGYFGSETIHGKRQVFRLKGLDERSPYYNKRFEELKESDQRKLKNSVLRAINTRQLSPTGQTSIYHIFERLNTGGTPLKPQEIRNVVFRGNLKQIITALNEDEDWRLILGKKTFDRHQKDVELVLRIFALSEYLDLYEKPMKEFLNKIMGSEKKGNSSRVKKFEETFPIATELITDRLGKKPFHVRGPLNTSVLDSVFCAILRNVNRIPNDLKSRFEKLKEDGPFYDMTTIGTTDAKVVNTRFNYVKAFLID